VQSVNAARIARRLYTCRFRKQPTMPVPGPLVAIERASGSVNETCVATGLRIVTHFEWLLP
jgi:hypothetical protein